MIPVTSGSGSPPPGAIRPSSAPGSPLSPRGALKWFLLECAHYGTPLSQRGTRVAGRPGDAIDCAVCEQPRRIVRQEKAVR